MFGARRVARRTGRRTARRISRRQKEAVGPEAPAAGGRGVPGPRPRDLAERRLIRRAS